MRRLLLTFIAVALVVVSVPIARATYGTSPRDVCPRVSLVAQPGRAVTAHMRCRGNAVFYAYGPGGQFRLSDHVDDATLLYGEGCAVLLRQRGDHLTARLTTVRRAQVHVRLTFLDR